MRIRTICIVAAVTWLLPLGGCQNSDGLQLAAGAMAGDNTSELRVGAQAGPLEAYLAPRYAEDRAETGDLATELRGYAIYNAIDANLVATLARSEVTLPAGALYGGLFGGVEFEDGATEAGWLVGARVRLGLLDDYPLDLATEYQFTTRAYRDDNDDYTLMIGPRLLFDKEGD